MSEYQSYHFQTVGRVLSAEARREVGELSSHIDVGASEASVEYSHGDFKHNPIRVLGRFFDVLVYRASWGSQMLGFRFDEGAVDTEALRVYEVPEFISVDRKGANVIVQVSFDENGPNGWIDPEDPDPRAFAVLYEEIGRGDYQALFLMWLQARELFGEDADAAAPVPDGLGELHEVHEALIDLIDLNANLVEAAKVWSRPLAAGEARAAVRFTDLRESVEKLEAERERKRREEAERRRAEYLGRLARREEEVFPAVEAWIATKTTKGYDAAIDLLLGLEELAKNRGEAEEAAFRARVREIAGKYPRLPSLQERFSAAGWKEQPARKLEYWEERRAEEFAKRRAAGKEMDFGLLRGPGR